MNTAAVERVSHQLAHITIYPTHRWRPAVTAWIQAGLDPDDLLDDLLDLAHLGPAAVEATARTTFAYAAHDVRAALNDLAQVMEPPWLTRLLRRLAPWLYRK